MNAARPRVALAACAALAALLALCAASSVRAQEKEIRQSIKTQQDRAEERQRKIESMEQRERRIRDELARVEKNVAQLTREVSEREAELAGLERAEAEARERYRELQARRDALLKELSRLVRSLWPLHAGRLAGRLHGLDTWHEADRRLTWLGAIYEATAQRMRQVDEASRHMAENLEEQARLAAQASEALAQVNTAKDELLKKRLGLLAAERRTRAELKDLEGELRSILAVIQELNYKLKSQRTKRFADNKKLLPWPVKGRVASTFAPWATPPRRGIILSAREAETVTAVFWGKAVHADTLRGFGRVVILYHGHDYYSVYAYLTSTMVHAGQEVEKDEPIGTAGFDPHTKEHGLYFELRLGAKPINPLLWLYPK